MKKSLKNDSKAGKSATTSASFDRHGRRAADPVADDQIADSSKQKEVRQAVQLITHELEDNLQIIRRYEERYNEEKTGRPASAGRAVFNDGASRRYNTALFADGSQRSQKPFEFSTDALEMFKTSGIAPHIADKELVTELLRCYKSLESFDKTLGAYYDERRVVFTTQMEMDFRSEPISARYSTKRSPTKGAGVALPCFRVPSTGDSLPITGRRSKR